MPTPNVPLHDHRGQTRWEEFWTLVFASRYSGGRVRVLPGSEGMWGRAKPSPYQQERKLPLGQAISNVTVACCQTDNELDIAELRVPPKFPFWRTRRLCKATLQTLSHANPRAAEMHSQGPPAAAPASSFAGTPAR